MARLSARQIALGALGAAHSLGRRVPDDLAFVGFDDIPESAYFWPPLTTVRQPLIEAGRIAVKTLLADGVPPKIGMNPSHLCRNGSM